MHVAHFMKQPLKYYLGEGWHLYAVPYVNKNGAGLEKAIADFNEKTVHGSPFFLVYTRSFHGDPGFYFFKALKNMCHLKKEAEFAGVDLYRGTKISDLKFEDLKKKPQLTNLSWSKI